MEEDKCGINEMHPHLKKGYVFSNKRNVDTFMQNNHWKY